MLTPPQRLSLAAAAVTVFTALSGIAYANHSWGGYHWARTSNPFTIKLGDNVSPTWDAYLVTASNDWTASSVLDTTVVPGNGSRPIQCKPTLGRVEVCNTSYGKNGWLGIAQIWLSGGHIAQGVVKMNDSYFGKAPYNTPAWRNLVMCQEVGHTFGLAHQDENFSNANLGTCMDYTNYPESNQYPNQHDYDELEEIYVHLDGSTTVGQSTDSAKGEDLGNDPKAWGKIIHESEDGRSTVHELDLGNGNKVITHVLWAEGRGKSNEARDE